jgi:DnaJ-class molecular chaperone
MKGKLRDLQVSLEDVYEGKMVNLPHTRKRCCVECDGKGGKNANTCGTCKGRKMVQKLIMLGPGMYSQ